MHPTKPRLSRGTPAGDGEGVLTTRFVDASDGVQLAVHERGNPDAPTVLCVHGFPDDHRVWDGVAGELASTLRVVTFDVRGSGASGRPRRISDYRLDQLADDIGRVVDAVSPGRPVHLAGHDWGSVQAWHAATDPAQRHRIASLTSISGPCLDHVPYWIRSRLAAGPRGWKDLLGQWKSPLYMGFFQIPWVAPLACRLGLVDSTIALASHFETGVRPADVSAHRAHDNRGALRIYTANLLPRLLRPQERTTDVPVQVLAPRRDIFITPASQVDIGRWAVDSRVHSVDGGHWIPLFNPTAIADLVRSFVGEHEPETTNSNGEPR
ncbi:alpha/beta fold hydrolase [Rhodococcus sp. NPDC127530]|uniref:alpha/beta fold hydrolase n=1 Tax=unclassified Rhodococcus (in: high G+C Gram-positive bacteria) TaxID=192944 RepID=UPI00363B6D0A